MLVPIHLMPPSTFKYSSMRAPALVSAANLRGARNICSEEWSNEHTDYCRQIGTVMVDNEQDLMAPAVTSTHPTQSSTVECADPTAVRDSTILLLACWFCIFAQLAVLSERK